MIFYVIYIRSIFFGWKIFMVFKKSNGIKKPPEQQVLLWRFWRVPITGTAIDAASIKEASVHPAALLSEGNAAS